MLEGYERNTLFRGKVEKTRNGWGAITIHFFQDNDPKNNSIFPYTAFSGTGVGNFQNIFTSQQEAPYS